MSKVSSCWPALASRAASKPLSPFVFGLFALLTSSPALADYPIASHRYLADPGALVFEGRVYLYNSNDDDNPIEGGYEMKSIVCVSSSDMKNWTDHGEVLRVPANASWANYSWAPYPLLRDGKIYLYFGNNANGVGVATSTNPTSGFKDGKGSALVNSNTPGAAGNNIWLFDPGALIDDDGQAYLSFGGNGENNARIIKLGADLVSVSGSAAQLSPKGFFEASFMFKRNGIYYFAYSTDSANGLRIDYLTSDKPMSGYTYRGVIADQPPMNNNNNHASEFEFKGKWYHAYHNRAVATQAGISTTYRRNIAMEVLEFNADGSIQEVKYTTDGVPQVGTLNPYERVEAETMNAQSGIETEPCKAGGMDVTQISNGDWIKVRGVDFGSGAKSFSAQVASAAGGGSIEIHLGSATGTLLGKCEVPATGGAQTWMTTTCDVTGATGVNDVTFKFVGDKGELFNFDYWQFTSVDGGTGGSGGAGGMAGAGGAGGNGGGAGGAGTSSGGGQSGSAGGGAGGTAAGTAGVSGAPVMPSGGAGGAISGAGGASGASSASGGSSATAGSSALGGSGAAMASGGALPVGSGGQSAAGANAGQPAGESSGCACTTARGNRTNAGVLAAGLAVCALALRRRQRVSTSAR